MRYGGGCRWRWRWEMGEGEGEGDGDGDSDEVWLGPRLWCAGLAWVVLL
jgi:hypothetical protein